LVVLCATVGVPVITQVFEMLSPAGKEGVALHEVTAPALLVGVTVVMAVLMDQLYGLPE
jgi:hypothetical protein